MPADAVILLFLLILIPLAAGAVCLVAAWGRIRRRTGVVPPDSRMFVERRWILIPAASILGIFLLIIFWAWAIEPGRLEVTETEIRVKQPVLGHDRFRIVHLSDLHIEGNVTLITSMLEAVRAAEPHLILLTGDYLNSQEFTPKLESVLASLDAPYGVYGVPGNWDRKFIMPELFETAARKRGSPILGPRLLEDEHVLLKGQGRNVLIVGLSMRPHRTLEELLAGASGDSYRIFLHHSPDAVREITSLPDGQRIDLFLCGHTHGGQIRIPFWGAVITMTESHKKYEMGLYSVGDTQMYVNRGVGMTGGWAPRLRFNCRPEVAVIDLVYEP